MRSEGLTPHNTFPLVKFSRHSETMGCKGQESQVSGQNNKHVRSVISWIRETVWGIFLAFHINQDLRSWHFLCFYLHWNVFFWQWLGLNTLANLGSIWKREKWFVSALTMAPPDGNSPPVPKAAGCLIRSVPSPQAPASQISIFSVTTHLLSYPSCLRALWYWSYLAS